MRSISGGSVVCSPKTASSLTAVTEGSYSNKDVGQTLSLSLCACEREGGRERTWEVCHRKWSWSVSFSEDTGCLHINLITLRYN